MMRMRWITAGALVVAAMLAGCAPTGPSTVSAPSTDAVAVVGDGAPDPASALQGSWWARFQGDVIGVTDPWLVTIDGDRLTLERDGCRALAWRFELVGDELRLLEQVTPRPGGTTCFVAFTTDFLRGDYRVRVEADGFRLSPLEVVESADARDAVDALRDLVLVHRATGEATQPWFPSGVTPASAADLEGPWGVGARPELQFAGGRWSAASGDGGRYRLDANGGLRLTTEYIGYQSYSARQRLDSVVSAGIDVDGALVLIGATGVMRILEPSGSMLLRSLPSTTAAGVDEDLAGAWRGRLDGVDGDLQVIVRENEISVRIGCARLLVGAASVDGGLVVLGDWYISERLVDDIADSNCAPMHRMTRERLDTGRYDVARVGAGWRFTSPEGRVLHLDDRLDPSVGDGVLPILDRQPAPPAALPADVAPADLDDIAGTWVPTGSWANSGGARVRFAPERGVYSGTTGCNAFRGAIGQGPAGGVVALDPAYRTSAYCWPALDTGSLLSRTAGLGWRGERLVLLDAEGAVLVELARTGA